MHDFRTLADAAWNCRYRVGSVGLNEEQRREYVKWQIKDKDMEQTDRFRNEE